MPESVKLIQRELQYRRELLLQYEAMIRSAPEGHLCMRTYPSGEQVNYHHHRDVRTGKAKRSTLHSADRDLIAKLKLKSYANACIPALKKSIRMIEGCLKAQAVFDPEKTELQMGSGYKDIFLEFHRLYKYPESETWQALRERQNLSFPESLRYQTAEGQYRSKSEMVIAMQLARFEIPFKYEPVIDLGSFHFFPDFAILNPLDGELVYWEHLGLLDKEDYRRSTERKLALYHASGIRPGDNLILTCDGDAAPLSALKIERVIRANFT